MISGAPETLPFDEGAILTRFDPGGRRERYFDLLMEENSRVNLVSRETSRQSFNRLVAESLLPLTVLDPAPVVAHLDIGSGGGFPLLPLTLSGVAESQTGCERTQKKAAALVRISKAMGFSLTIIPRTFEDIHFERRFDLVTLRYVKLTPSLLSGIRRVLCDTGVLIYYSDPSFAIDRAAIRRFHFQIGVDQPFKHFCLINPK